MRRLALVMAFAILGLVVVALSADLLQERELDRLGLRLLPLVAVAAAAPLLAWTARRRQLLLRRHVLVATAVTTVAMLVPLDLVVRRTGQVGVHGQAVLWGHPSDARTLARLKAGDELWGGCRVPLNPIPTRYAVVISL
jgi:hypothetical protein